MMLPNNTIQIFLSCIIACNGIINVEGNVDGDGDEKSFTTQATFIEIYAVIIFIVAAYYIGYLGSLIKLPSLVGHIITGILLGPPLLDFVPYVKALIVMGEIGLILQMVEAGIELDVGLLRNSGVRAIALSITSAMLATGAGICVGILFGLDFQGAYSIGATFAQTGNAVCLPVLRSAGLMNTPVGQMILAATIIDDMIALTLLSVLMSFGSDQSSSVIDYFTPIISSIGSLLVLGLFAIVIAPRLIETHIFPKIPKRLKTCVLFLMMTVVSLLYLPLLHYIKASYLIGAFLSGATFSRVQSAHKTFLLNGTDAIFWLNMLFFACTIGFQVPIKLFGKPKVWILGSVLALTAVAIKFVSAVFVPKFEDAEKGSIYNPHRRNQLVTGIAMTCRGGFGLLIAASALNIGIIDPEIYASIILAVLCGIVIPPFLLNFVTNRYSNLRSIVSQRNKSDGKMNLFLHIHLETKGAWGLVEKIAHTMSSLNLNIVKFETRSSRDVSNIVINDIYIRDNAISVMIPDRQSKETNIGNKTDKSCTGSDMIEGEMVDKRCKNILHSVTKEVIQFGATNIEITQWDPFDLNDALDALVLTRENGKVPSIDFFSNMFEFLDKDGDGHLDIYELRAGMKDACFNISDEGISTLLQSMPDDSDNVISFEEWNNVIKKYVDRKKKKKRFSIIGNENIRRMSAIDNVVAEDFRRLSEMFNGDEEDFEINV